MYASMFMQTLGPTETEIMQLLWESGPATAGELHETLIQQRDIAYTTVKTTADRLVAKGLATRQVVPNRWLNPYCYTPMVTRAELLTIVVQKMCADLNATAEDRQKMREALATIV